MIDLYRAGFEYGYNGDTRILEKIPESLSADEIAEFNRGMVDGTRKANNMAILFVCALALAVVALLTMLSPIRNESMLLNAQLLATLTLAVLSVLHCWSLVNHGK